jgi:hypothetical protein
MRVVYSYRDFWIILHVYRDDTHCPCLLPATRPQSPPEGLKLKTPDAPTAIVLFTQN